MFRVNKPDIAIRAVSADRTDDKVIECAVSARADVIISGDKHLLNLKKYRTIPIIKPAEFIKKITK